jgi:hypothetical protein
LSKIWRYMGVAEIFIAEIDSRLAAEAITLLFVTCACDWNGAGFLGDEYIRVVVNDVED